MLSSIRTHPGIRHTDTQSYGVRGSLSAVSLESSPTLKFSGLNGLTKTSAVSPLTWAPGVEEHHQSSKGGPITQGLCKQWVPPHRSIDRRGHGQGHDPSLQIGALVNIVLPYGLDVTSVHWRRVTKLRTGPTLFWRSRTWWGWWVGLDWRWVNILHQNSCKWL